MPQRPEKDVGCLGLRKTNRVVEHEYSPSIWGMVEKVKHLVSVTENHKLYVIGNGFDLHHGIQSSYFNFKDFLENNDTDVYDVVEKYLGNTDDFWSSFENNLAWLDEDQIKDYASNFLVSYGADDWSDAYHHDYQFEIERIITPLTEGLRKNFIEWVLQLNIEHKKNQLLDIDKKASFLTFNYTKTLETLYRINMQNIKYIHNKAIDSNSDLVFGHNQIKPSNKPDLEKLKKELTEKEYLNYIDELGADDVRVTEGEDIIYSYFEKTRKPTEKIIEANKAFFCSLKNIDEVIIIGHSLDSIDMPYFEKIYKSMNKRDVKWIVSYYDKNDINNHRKKLTDIGIRKDLIKNVYMDYFYPKKGVLFP